MPLLSIIIPIYNVENYLDDCIKSILKQDFKDYEVILVDNASTDKSGEICEQYASEYSNVKVIHLDTNVLPGGARNVGLKAAKGEYVHFCDGDDYYPDNIFSDIAEIIVTTSPTVLFGQFMSIPEKGAYVCNSTQLDSRVFKLNNSESLIEHIFTIPNFLCTVWRFLVKREFLLSNNIVFPEGCHSEDEEWVPKVLCSTEKFALLDKTIYYYRPRAVGSVTSSRTFLHTKSKLLVAFNLLRFLYKNNFKGIRKKFIHSRINMLLGSFSTRCDTFTEKQINELENIIKENKDILHKLDEIEDRQDLYRYISEYDLHEGIKHYCKYVVEKTLKIVNGRENKDIYIFPTGNNGESTARILQKADYKVEGFLDNSKSKKGCIINGLPVYLPKVLKEMSNSELQNIFIIVSVQQKTIASSIMNQLREYGLTENQFTSRIY